MSQYLSRKDNNENRYYQGDLSAAKNKLHYLKTDFIQKIIFLQGFSHFSRLSWVLGTTKMASIQEFHKLRTRQLSLF